MKKQILPLLLISVLLAAPAKMQGQCTPQPGNTALISPDTTTNFASGTVGIPYQQLVYVHPPVDTLANTPFGPQNVTIIDIVLNSVANLPPGLSYTCNPANCTFPGGVSGCLAITGTPLTAGTYDLNVIITTTGTVIIFGTPFQISQQDTIESYRITVDPNTSGIASLNQDNFQILNIESSQGNDVLISLNAPRKIKAIVKISDLIGNSVMSTGRWLNSGMNNLRLSAPDLKSGIYFLTVTAGANSLTGRFVVLNSR